MSLSLLYYFSHWANQHETHVSFSHFPYRGLNSICADCAIGPSSTCD